MKLNASFKLIVLFALAATLTACAKKEPPVASYDECVKAGYPIQESYPPRCVTPDKKVFVQEISVVLPNSKPSGTAETQKTITGIVKTGEESGKKHCQEGLYINDSKLGNIQIREKDQARYSKMISDKNYIGKNVEITGKYPGQEMMCNAIICDCDDYILADSIKILK